MSIFPSYLLVSSKRYRAEAERPPLWTHKEDRDVFGRLRDCATDGSSCPAVFVLKEPRKKVELTKDWQYYLAAINYNMNPADVATELHYRLAFANQTGLGREALPRRNYLRDKDLTAAEYPRFDKDRTCSRSVMTGTVDGAYLIVTTLDGNQPPPLKPGRSYPQRVADINPDDYLYTPQTHRHLFFSANTVGSSSGGSKVYPFPRGATYDWIGDGWRYTFLPHVSCETIRYPLARLRKLGDNEPIPSPYRTS
jgi:hypothetical protein